MIKFLYLGICYIDTDLEMVAQRREEEKKMKRVETLRQVLEGLGRQGLFLDENQ